MSYRQNTQTKDSLKVFLNHQFRVTIRLFKMCIHNNWRAVKFELFQKLCSKYLERIRQEKTISSNLQTWSAAARVVMELLTSGTECSSVLLTSDCPTAWQSKMCLIVRRVRWLRPLLVLCLLLHTCESKLTEFRPLSSRNMKIQVFWDKTPWRFEGAFCLCFQEDE